MSNTIRHVLCMDQILVDELRYMMYHHLTEHIEYEYHMNRVAGVAMVMDCVEEKHCDSRMCILCGVYNLLSIRD